MGHSFLGDRNTLAGPGISTHTRGSSVDRKAAESTNFYPVTPYQRIAYRVKNGLDRVFCVAMGQLVKSRSQFFNQVGTCHRERRLASHHYGRTAARILQPRSWSARLFGFVAVQLGAQQCTKVGQAGVVTRRLLAQ